MAKLFEPYHVKGVTLRNRIVMAPMCQYMAGADGVATPWHLVHYGARAVGGVGLVILEATAVEPIGRISEGDLGLWSDEQIAPLREVVSFCQAHGAKVAVQLAHAGRKAWSRTKGVGPGQPVAPSAVPFDADHVVPEALTAEGIARIVKAFGAAAQRAQQAGFDLVEIHGAHGYLINEFLSPLANQRTDAYGEDRLRFLGEVTGAVKANFTGPIFLRISASDYLPEGLGPADYVAMVPAFKGFGIDLIDVSSGGVSPAPIETYPGYQVGFASQIRQQGQVPTGAVGLIQAAEHAEAVVAGGHADLLFLGRELLRDPHWPLRAARELGVDIDWPQPYWRAK